jgi:hypothetical protein
MRNVLIGALAVLVGAAAAQASVTAWIEPVVDPNLLPGLAAYKLKACTTDGADIFNVKNLSITGAVHQAFMGTPPAGQTPWTESWATQPPALQPAQLANDTRLLLVADTPLGTDTLPDIGAPTETNDSSNPTGGTVLFDVSGSSFPCALGLGSLTHSGGIGQDQANRYYVMDIAYVVVPAGNVASASMTATISYGGEGDPRYTFPEDQAVGVDIPEPATMSLLALGACLPLLRRRR